MRVKKVACIGAGLVGSSWATLFAWKGLEVCIQDLNEEYLMRTARRIESNLDFLVKNKLLRKDEVSAVLKRIKKTVSVAEAVKYADYVQESIFERYDVKKAVFKEMDAAAAEEAILASSSSGLLMTEIQKATEKPQRCLLAHPYNPPHLIPLVELVGGDETSTETVETVYEFMLELGKIPVILRKETPGCIWNRLQAALLREAIDLVDKGVASVDEVDKTVRAGPALRLAVTGIFLTHHLGGGGIERFFDTLGPSYTERWKTMETWASIPPSAAKKVIEGANRMDIIRIKTVEEIARLRDNKLVKLLKLINE